MPERLSVAANLPLRIYLLGGFRVVVAGRQVGDARWQLRKARSLVKLLALSPGHQLHREQIWDQLWPDMQPEAAANNFHRTLHMARRALDPALTGAPAAGSAPYLLLRGDLLTLAPDVALWIDVEAFAAAAAEAHASGDPLAYRAALELYAGDLLPEDRYEDWAAPHRDALRQRYSTLLGELAELYENRDEREHAIETLGRLLAADPAHEWPHRALMRLYARGGLRQQALRQYESLRQALERELSALPGARANPSVCRRQVARRRRAGGH